MAVPIPAAAADAGELYRARRRVPSPYRIAQLVDQRLELADTLSTAFYFQPGIRVRASPSDVQRYQHERPNELSRSVDVRQGDSLHHAAHGIRDGRAAAGGVQPLRAALRPQPASLDLKPPLARMLQDQLGGHPGPRSPRTRAASSAASSADSQDDPGAAADDPETAGRSAAGQAGERTIRKHGGPAASPTRKARSEGRFQTAGRRATRAATRATRRRKTSRTTSQAILRRRRAAGPERQAGSGPRRHKQDATIPARIPAC